MEKYLWIIPMAPLAGAAINGFIAMATAQREKGVNERLLAFIGCAASIVSFVVVAALFLKMRTVRS